MAPNQNHIKVVVHAGSLQKLISPQ